MKIIPQRRKHQNFAMCSSGQSVLVLISANGHTPFVCGQKTWTVHIPALILLNSHGSRLSPQGAHVIRLQSSSAKAHRKKQTAPQGEKRRGQIRVITRWVESNVEHIEETVFATIIQHCATVVQE